MAYCLALLLGVSREAEKARQDLEIPRRRPRHGSCRTLSVLYVALAMLSHPRWRERAQGQLQFLVGWVASGPSLMRRAPPMVVYRHSAAALKHLDQYVRKPCWEIFNPLIEKAAIAAAYKT